MTTIFNKYRERDKRKQLRSVMPVAEKILWSKLRAKQIYGHRFRRQYSIGRYVVDFCCPQANLVIELDGDSHFTNQAQQYDQQRTEYIRSLGMKVIRFTNLEIKENLYGVLDQIVKELQRFQPLSPP